MKIIHYFLIFLISVSCRKEAEQLSSTNSITTLSSFQTTMRLGEPYNSLFDTFVRYRNGNFIAGPTCVKTENPQFRAAEKMESKMEYGETFDRMVATASLKGSIEAPFLSSFAKIKLQAEFASSFAKTSFTRSIYTSFQWEAGNLSMSQPFADPYHRDLWIEPLGLITDVSGQIVSPQLKNYYWRIPILNNNELDQERKNLLNIKEASLLENCGDEFVSQINLGARFIVGIVYHFTSQEFAQKFSMKATAKFGKGKLSYRREVFDEDEQLQEIFSSAYVKTYLVQEGGNNQEFSLLFPSTHSPSCPLKIPFDSHGEIDMEKFESQLHPCFDLYNRAIVYGKQFFANLNDLHLSTSFDHLKINYYATRRYDQAGLYQLQVDRKSHLSDEEQKRLQIKVEQIRQDIEKFQIISQRIQHECKTVKDIINDLANESLAITQPLEHSDEMTRHRDEVCKFGLTGKLIDYIDLSRERYACYLDKLYLRIPINHDSQNSEFECEKVEIQKPDFSQYLKENILKDLM